MLDSMTMYWADKRVAGAVVAAGLAMLIAGAVMLGVGISKSNSVSTQDVALAATTPCPAPPPPVPTTQCPTVPPATVPTPCPTAAPTAGTTPNTTPAPPVAIQSTPVPNAKGCSFRDTPNGGLNCVCNATYCDELPTNWDKSNEGHALFTISTKSGLRWAQSIVPTNQKSIDVGDEQKPDKGIAIVELDMGWERQDIYGFGGAMSDSTSIMINSLSKETQDQIMNAHFGPTGVDYTMIRVPIGGCDFSARNYTLCDSDGDDFNLTKFSLQQEDFDKIPLLKRAAEMSKDEMKLFASPWSSPAWMKFNNNTRYGGAIKGDIINKEGDKRYYDSFAKYYIKFFEEYAKQGVKYWGLTMLNEPNEANPGYGNLVTDFSPIVQNRFAAHHLGPALKANPLTKDLKLMINDDNRNYLPQHPNAIFTDESNPYIDGTAIHWYSWWIGPEGLEMTHWAHQDKFILATEACNAWGYDAIRWNPHGPSPGNWTYAEYYVQNIIEDLNHWTTGWVDWNMVLNQAGGPSWVGASVDAPVIANPEKDEFYKQPMYYGLGHFSKYMRPGMKHIQAEVTSFHGSNLGCKALALVPNLCVSAVISPNDKKKIVVVLLNRDPDTDYRVKLRIKFNKDFGLAVDMERNSIATVVFDAPPSHQ